MPSNKKHRNRFSASSAISNNMEEKKSVKYLFEMSHKEAIEQRKENKDSLLSQIQFGRFARHCLDCEECRTEAREVGLLVSMKS